MIEVVLPTYTYNEEWALAGLIGEVTTKAQNGNASPTASAPGQDDR
jgi:hypothetical protein